VRALRDLLSDAREAGDLWIGTVGELAEHHRGPGGDVPDTEVTSAGTGWPL
jgi:hypothetical protein